MVGGGRAIGRAVGWRWAVGWVADGGWWMVNSRSGLTDDGLRGGVRSGLTLLWRVAQLQAALLLLSTLESHEEVADTLVINLDH